ncbi:MAG: aminodeoxychorismate synthase component I [Gammaproteobacteria bacterium]|nr:MAG: aminodeoxychorismate synthase component I [Gammaproteobacteria bacterium]
MGGDPLKSGQPAGNEPHTCLVDRAFDLIDLHDSDPSRYPHLLQSTAHGRYDILFACPEESLVLDARGLHGPGSGQADFLAGFDAWWSGLQTSPPATTSLPFRGGWFVYLGYELAEQIEPSLSLPRPGGQLPVALATRFPCAIIRDHEQETTTIITEPGYAGRIPDIEADIAGLSEAGNAAAGALELESIDEAPPAQYLDAVRRIHEYIRQGDVFQVNLSRRWTVNCRDPVRAQVLYKRLRRHNPSPYSGLARFGELAVIRSSPERLVRVQGNRVETRPIAGTRPRSLARADDEAFSRELLSHPKERAEHIMLIDLERNDLGRVCRPGTVQVDEFMVLESYAHVHHIVSNVRGELRADVTPGDVIRAVFPGGTITGCPKVRCMEIIAELEQEPRDAYTGSMGYINRDGSMDLNILIRSMQVSGNTVQLRAGAGIVADSVPEAELEETRAKARGLLRALGINTD